MPRGTIIRTVARVYQSDDDIDAIGAVNMFIKNEGTIDCTLWGRFTLAAGDAGLSLPGDIAAGAVRDDRIPLKFSAGAGTKKVVVLKDVIVSEG